MIYFICGFLVGFFLGASIALGWSIRQVRSLRRDYEQLAASAARMRIGGGAAVAQRT